MIQQIQASTKTSCEHADLLARSSAASEHLILYKVIMYNFVPPPHSSICYQTSKIPAIKSKAYQDGSTTPPPNESIFYFELNHGSIVQAAAYVKK